MEKNILTLLNNNLRVIIPDFGAFIVRQKEPRIVVFNEFLRFNDGLLIDHIIKNEGVEPDIASRMVSDFTEEAVKTLAGGRPFVIKGLGMLEKDATGKITFTTEGHEKYKKAPAVAEPEIIVSEPVPVTHVAPVTPDAAVIVDAPVKPVAQVAASGPKDQEVLEVEEVMESRDLLHDKPSGRRINMILIWVLLFLLANALVLGWFVFRNGNHRLFSAGNIPGVLPDSNAANLSGSVNISSIDTALLLSQITGDSGMMSNQGESTGNMKYYIVAGCFRDEINADALVKVLKDKGYNAEKFGRIKDLYAVSYASFSDKDLAEKELKRIKEEVDPNAWRTRY